MLRDLSLLGRPVSRELRRSRTESGSSGYLDK